MDCIEGKSLKSYMQEEVKLEDIVAIILQIANILQSVHHESVIHRDIKPENIIVDENKQLWIVDFGLAKLESFGSQKEIETALTTDQGILGTLAYMSPEQASGETVTTSTDLYSLGVLFYEFLTGNRLIERNNSLAMLKQIIKDDVVFPKGYQHHDPHLEKICLSILAKNHEDRSTIKQFIDDLKAWEKGEYPISANVAFLESTKSRKIPAELYFVLFVLFIISTTLYFFIKYESKSNNIKNNEIAKNSTLDNKQVEKNKIDGIPETSKKIKNSETNVVREHAVDNNTELITNSTSKSKKFNNKITKTNKSFPQEKKPNFQVKLIQGFNKKELTASETYFSKNNEGNIKKGCFYRIGFLSDVSCFVYLFQIDSEGGIYRLFPKPDNQLSLWNYTFSPNIIAKKIYIIPPKEFQPLQLDNIDGKEAFYFLYSFKALDNPKQVLLNNISNDKKDNIFILILDKI